MTATQASSKSGKYLSPQYAATDFSFPHAQVVRGEEDMTHCGYFIPLPQAQKAGWSNLEATETIIYTYNNGEKAEGILLAQPSGWRSSYLLVPSRTSYRALGSADLPPLWW